jgi:Icc-related predicted phosphoesterase
MALCGPVTTMRICHVSDTHGGLFPLEGDFDVIVHSGDFMPNAPNFRESQRTRAHDPKYQRNWIGHNKKKIREWTQGRKLLLCRGNHDFFDPIPDMQGYAIDCTDITNRTVALNGSVFCGFPWVPYMSGEWAFELRVPEMRHQIDFLIASYRNRPFNVLVAHCPPAHILDVDENGDHAGNGPMMSALTYSTDLVLSHYLCGHIHPSHGVANEGGVLFSNAATTQRLIEVPWIV